MRYILFKKPGETNLGAAPNIFKRMSVKIDDLQDDYLKDEFLCAAISDDRQAVYYSEMRTNNDKSVKQMKAAGYEIVAEVAELRQVRDTHGRPLYRGQWKSWATPEVFADIKFAEIK